MKLLATAALVLLASCAADKPWKQAVVLQGGAKQYQNDLEPVDDQLVAGLEWSGRPADSALGLEVGVAYSSADDTGEIDLGGGPISASVDMSVLEFYAGPRLTFEAGAARPYLGTGVSYQSAEFEFGEGGPETIEDAAFAGYVHGGADFLLGNHFLLGVDMRYIFAADFDEGDATLEADSLQLTGRIGWSF